MKLRMKKRLGRKRGSYIVEAALLYPLVIMISLSIMSVTLYFYQQAAEAAGYELESRRLADAESGTVTYSDMSVDIYGNSTPGAIYKVNRADKNECSTIWKRQQLSEFIGLDSESEDGEDTSGQDGAKG